VALWTDSRRIGAHVASMSALKLAHINPIGSHKSYTIFYLD